MPHQMECLERCVCETDSLDLTAFLLDNAHQITLRQHPLGFADVVAADFRLDRARKRHRRLAIHIWHPLAAEAELPRSVCHSHGWAMLSTVHVGAISDRRFEVEQDSDGPQHLFEVVYEKEEAASLREQGKVRSSLQSSDVISAGASYELGPNVFHESVSAAPITTTSMLAIAAAHAEPPRIVYDDLRASAGTRRVLIDPAAANKIIADVVAAV